MSALPKAAAASLAEPKQAAAEVLAGRPGPAARRWLGPTALVVFVLFALDTFLVVQNDVLPFDVPIAKLRMTGSRPRSHRLSKWSGFMPRSGPLTKRLSSASGNLLQRSQTTAIARAA